jgi:SAM-dependent methyltransferase
MNSRQVGGYGDTDYDAAVDETVKSRLGRFAKAEIKRIAPTLVYPKPVSGLQPQRLYAYLDALWQRREVEGAVVEIGCWMGGTAAIAYQMLARTGHRKRYVCVDTFSGFVQAQFDRDVEHGTPRSSRRIFSDTSRDIVARLLSHWDCSEIELIQADVGQLDAGILPEQIAVALVDVDLDIPVYEGLIRVLPRLAPGGIALVDDCPPSHSWAGARKGYERFVAEAGLPEEYFMDMGIVHVPGPAS